MRIGIDTGGTFTDFVIFNPEDHSLHTFKILSTPNDPAEAILAGLQKLHSSDEKREIIHGSTVATNALLERKGARTALVTTKGFKDVLQIGRQNRPALYDLFANPPEPLIPAHWRIEVNERVNFEGVVQIPLADEDIYALLPIFKENDIEAVAISLLFSFAYPEHEQRIAKILQDVGYFVSSSSEILPEFREYERTSTTAMNAYVSPIMGRYLSKLEQALPGDALQIMQSNGGAISPKEAQQQAVRCILSGPAGGVVGAQAVASAAGFERIISFDMGGTSSDVSLVDGKLLVSTEANVGDLPIRIPILDIHTVGSGGGSIAQIDAGGALRVGPESAGADPGPACYGKGNQPTVTDANVVLGRLRSEHFLGGTMQLNPDAAHKTITKLGKQIALSPQETALGIIQIANAHMARALRVISIERGFDPRDFTLVSFGGAGGLHAVDLAREVGIPTVLIPPQASTLSALGMLMADMIKDYSQTIMLPGNVLFTGIEEKIQPLVDRGKGDLTAEGVRPENMLIEPSVDLRYQGQSFELNLPLSKKLIAEFHQVHEQAYGYANPEAPVEIVNIRVKAIGTTRKPTLPTFSNNGVNTDAAILDTQPVLFKTGELATVFYKAEELQTGNLISGPAIIIRKDTTILIGSKDKAEVDTYTNLIIHVHQPKTEMEV